jgi:alkanesulfonate monooxygenase SsuD/methylene tetrahydromethanopterin reductase-like flavin-dependent oxidoreductase (luciferase family)
MPGLATGVLLQGFTAREIANLAAEADRSGFRDIWIAESSFGDAFGPAAAAALATSRARIGTGVVGVFGRSPAVMSLSALSLAQLANGRAVLGLGVQARPYVEDWHGVPFARGLDRVREYVQIIRQALRGEKVSLEGRTVRVRHFEMLAAPETVPIYLAAVGPRMIQLAGEIADGVLGAFFSPGYLRQTVLPNLEIGARRAGRSVHDVDVATIIPTLLTNAPDAREQIKPRLLMSVMARESSRFYRDCVAQAGFAAEADAAMQAAERGDIAAALRALPDALVDEMSVCGGRAELDATLARYAAAGLRTAVLQPCVPYAFYAYYEGHFPPSVRFPEPTTSEDHMQSVLRVVRQRVS